MTAWQHAEHRWQEARWRMWILLHVHEATGVEQILLALILWVVPVGSWFGKWEVLTSPKPRSVFRNVRYKMGKFRMVRSWCSVWVSQSIIFVFWNAIFPWCTHYLCQSFHLVYTRFSSLSGPRGMLVMNCEIPPHHTKWMHACYVFPIIILASLLFMF